MNLDKLKKIAKDIKDKAVENASHVDLSKLQEISEVAQRTIAEKVENIDFSNIEKVTYLTKAALTSKPGEIDYSQDVVEELRAREKSEADSFYNSILHDNKQKQFILFGDTNHTDTDLHAFFFGKENRERLVNMGIKHVVIEVEPEYQDIIDACAEGKIDTDGFIRAMQERLKELNPNVKSVKDNPLKEQRLEVMKLQAEALRYWHKNGIKVHCPDDRSDLKKHIGAVHGVYSLFFNALDYAKECGTEKPIVTQRLMVSYLFNSLARKEDSKRRPKHAVTKEELAQLQGGNVLMKKRMENDMKLAFRILDSVGGEPTAILFGSGHGNRKNGLAHLLGRSKTVCVNLHSKAEHYAEKGNVFMRDREDYHNPDYIHILDDNKVYKAPADKSNNTRFKSPRIR